MNQSQANEKGSTDIVINGEKYRRVTTSDEPSVITGTKVAAGPFNKTMNDIASAVSQSIDSDKKAVITSPTSPLPIPAHYVCVVYADGRRHYGKLDHNDHFYATSGDRWDSLMTPKERQAYLFGN